MAKMNLLDAGTFSNFLARHSLSIPTIYKMVTEYATSEKRFAASYFTKKYHLSSNHVFYRCRDFAVVRWLVDEPTRQELLKKAARNCREHNDKDGDTGPRKHAKFLKEQRTLFLESFTDEDIRCIVNRRLRYESTEKIACTYGTSALAVNYLIRRGIEKSGILDKETIRSIVSCISARHPWYNELVRFC